MKNMFRFAVAGLMLIALPFTACKDKGDDVNCTSDNVAEFIDGFTVDLAAAAEAYTTNPTPATCAAYIDELEKYRNFLSDYKDCAVNTLGYDDSDWTEAIQALDDIINIGC